MYLEGTFESTFWKNVDSNVPRGGHHGTAPFCRAETRVRQVDSRIYIMGHRHLPFSDLA